MSKYGEKKMKEEILKSRYVRRFIAAMLLVMVCAYAVGEFGIKKEYERLGTVDAALMQIEDKDIYLVQGREGYCNLVDGENNMLASLKPYRAYISIVGEKLLMESSDGYGMVDLKKAVDTGTTDAPVHDYIRLAEDMTYMIVTDAGKSRICTLDGDKVLDLGRDTGVFLGEGYAAINGQDGISRVISVPSGEKLFEAPEGERITGRGAGMWIIEGDTGEKKTIMSFFYLRDDDFRIALDGLLFSSVEGSEKYVGGCAITNVDYDNRRKIADFELIDPTMETENRIYNRRKELIFSSHTETIEGFKGDWFYSRQGNRKGVVPLSLEPGRIGEAATEEECIREGL